MAIYYYKLWDILKERKMTQKTLTEMTGISTATIFQMKRDEYVSVGVLDRITTALNCEYGDVMSKTERPKEHYSGYEYGLNLVNSRDLILDALNDYIKDNDLSLSDVQEITMLSLNTIKKFLKGENISQRSYYKLLRLGKEFENLIIKKYGKPVFGFI